MRKPRLRTLTVFVLAGLSGALLLRTSQSVQQAERALARIQSDVQTEEEALRVLGAEWAYLNAPARLEALSAQYLDLVAPMPGQVSGEAAMLPEMPSAADLPPAQPAAQPVAYGGASAKPAAGYPADAVMPRRKPKPPREDFNALLRKIDRGEDIR
jgi:hypothetical protein